MGPLPKGPEGFPLWRSLFGLAGIGLGLFVAYDAGGNGRFDESQVFVGGAIALVGASFFTLGFFSRAKNLAFGMPILVVLLVARYGRCERVRTPTQLRQPELLRGWLHVAWASRLPRLTP